MQTNMTSARLFIESENLVQGDDEFAKATGGFCKSLGRHNEHSQ